MAQIEDRSILARHDAELESHVEMIAREFREGFETVEVILACYERRCAHEAAVAG